MLPRLSTPARRSRSRCAGVVLLAAAAGGCASAPRSTAPLPAEVAIVWSADGSTVGGLGAGRTIHAFDGGSGRELWSVRVERPLFPGLARGVAIDRLRFLPEGHGALFAAGGDLFLWRADSAAGKRLTSTPEAELDAELAPNGDAVAFVRAGDLWALDLVTGEELRLTTRREIADSAALSPALPRFAWAPESRTLAFPAASPESGVLVVDLPTLTLRRLETGGAPGARIASYRWRPDARAIGVTRLAAGGSSLDLLLCHPEKLYCRDLATRMAANGTTERNDFLFLADGFLWGDRSGTGRGLGRYDIVGRETGTLLPPEWHLRELLAVDEDQSWAIATVSSASDSSRVATLAVRVAAGRATTFLAPARALDSRLFSPTRTFWVSFERHGGAVGAILASIDKGKVADLPGLRAPLDED